MKLYVEVYKKRIPPEELKCFCKMFLFLTFSQIFQTVFQSPNGLQASWQAVITLQKLTNNSRT